MIPESYTIGNFKAIGAPQTIALRPVTLIFGQNSAGKSSIIQSLLLSRFAMESGSFDFSSTKRWGQTIDLGGFRQYIHRHEMDRDLTIGFGFRRTKTEWANTALESQVERQASARAEDQSAPEWSFSFFNIIETLSVEVAVGLPDPMVSERLGHEHPVVKKLVIQADGEPLVSFSVDRQGNLQLSELFKNSHAMTMAMTCLLNSYRGALTFGEGGEWGDFDLGEVTKSLGTAPVDEKSFREIVSQVEQSYSAAVELRNQDFNDLLGASEEMARFIWILSAQLLDELKTPGRALSLQGRGLNYEIRSKNRLAPTRLEVVSTPEGEEAQDTGTALGSAVELEAIEDPLAFFRDDPEESDDTAALAKALRFDLEMVIDAALDSLRWWLLGTEYIGPYRSIPDRYFQIAKPDTSPEEGRVEHPATVEP